MKIFLLISFCLFIFFKIFVFFINLYNSFFKSKHYDINNKSRVLNSYMITIPSKNSLFLNISCTTLLIPYINHENDIPLGIRYNNNIELFTKSRIFSKNISKLEIINYFNNKNIDILCIEVNS